MRRIYKKNRSALRAIRHTRVRKTIAGTATKPRFSVYRALRSFTAQLIDDSSGRTLCYSKSSELPKGTKVEGKTGKVAVAYSVGQALAEKAIALGITKVVFDRGGYAYHGRVQSAAEGARAGGLQF